MKRLCIFVVFCLSSSALSWPQTSNEAAIQQLMQKQAEDWNRGDVNAFMEGYENSPKTAFVGDKVEYGYATILDRYKRLYATPAAMGKLTFTGLAIRVLDCGDAVATGNFHLDRGAESGGNADGIFSLVLRKGPSGWKIILDHTSRTH